MEEFRTMEMETLNLSDLILSQIPMDITDANPPPMFMSIQQSSPFEEFIGHRQSGLIARLTQLPTDITASGSAPPLFVDPALLAASSPFVNPASVEDETIEAVARVPNTAHEEMTSSIISATTTTESSGVGTSFKKR
jgi:hypothetical protein